MRNTHDQFTDDIGAYLLGALDPEEERAFEAHLESCDQCRDEVVRLEVARDALPRSVEQVAPPERLKQTLMAEVRADTAPRPERSRRSRWRDLLLARPAFAAAAAALLVAVGIGVGALIGAAGGGGNDSSTVAATVDTMRMPQGKASLVTSSDGGAILHVEGMQQPQAGKVYEVWIQRDGKVSPSSLFTVNSEGSGAAGIPQELGGADAILVTREPRAGSKTPSEPPVLMVKLPS